MHMILVITGGFVTFGLFMLFSYLWGGEQPDFGAGALYFLPVWLIISSINMWIGVTRAGYSVKAELPILLVVFGIPALAAGFALWRFSR